MRQAVAVLVALMVSGAPAWAQMSPSSQPSTKTQSPDILSDTGTPPAKEAQGKIVDVDRARKTLTLDDGTKLIIPLFAQFIPNNLQEGAIVKATYEVQDGQKLVTSIEVRGVEMRRKP